MPTPANAFAPGSPAAGPVAGDLLKLFGGGGGGVIPPLNLNFTSSASSRSGDAVQYGSTTGAGFNVNYGNGVSQGGGGMPQWVWLLAIAAGVWAWKRYT